MEIQINLTDFWKSQKVGGGGGGGVMQSDKFI